MLRRRILIIVNPAAGWRQRTRRRLDRVTGALRRLGCVVAVQPTVPAMGEVECLVREAAAEFDVIVAAGGDGTISAVVNGLVGLSRPLAVVPCGTANVLAHEIALPARPEALAELIAVRPARPIWPGAVCDRLFLTTASSGFDAEIVERIDPRLKRRIGRGAFAWAIAGALPGYRSAELRVSVGGAEHYATMMVAAKGRFYAGPFAIAAADLGEPALDFVLCQRSGRLAMLRYLAALPLGHIAGRADVAVARGREALVSASTPLPVQADGEIVGHLPARFSVASEPLMLIRP
ncbi:MAG: diacylglycerol/lipid kinase family protein [Thiohalocapsa sp.]